MALELTILVGTMTGNAQLVAQELELMLDDGETRVAGARHGRPGRGGIRPGGPVPDLQLYLRPGRRAGQRQAALRIAHRGPARPRDVSYGVVALGDRTYGDTFCNGGRRFDAILGELGARRIGDILFHDASSGTLAEEVAAEWIGPWMTRVRERSGVAA